MPAAHALSPSMRPFGAGSAFRTDMLAMMEQADLLSELAWREIEVLARYMQAFEADPGCVVFQEGDPGTYMIILVGGRMVIRKESEAVKEAVISIEGCGRSIGEMSLIDREPRSASCKVIESATMLLLTREQFEKLCVSHPSIALKLLMRITKLMSRRLRLTSGQLVEHLPG